MTPEQLRALADYIVYRDSLAIARAADYLRAQADAAVPDGWKLVPAEPTPEMLVAARDWSIQKNGIAVGNDQATGCFQAMLAAATAAPQAEPDDDGALVLGEPDILTPEDIRRLVPQAEPKREPLSDDAISYEHACRSSYESACAASDFDSFKLGVRFAERAHGIGGSDDERP